MDWRTTRFDWNHARAFLVAVEEGSLGAAARALGATQPTLGRQVAALEAELGVALVDRAAGRRLVPTPEGRALLEHLRAMAEAAGRVSLTAAGHAAEVAGTVRITASRAISAFLLPGLVVALRREAPALEIEIVAADEIRDLSRREADIAVRNARPEDPDLVARKLGEGRARLFAAADWLERAGPFETPEALSRAPFVGFADPAPLRDALNAQGLALGDGSFPVRSADHLVHWELVKAGAGLGIMLESVGRAEPRVREAAPWFPPFRFEVWLVARRELATAARVRLVFDALAAGLAPGTRPSPPKARSTPPPRIG